MQVRPGPDANRPVAGIFAHVFDGGFGPGARIITLHLRAMAARPSDFSERTGEARIAVEAASCPQTDEDLARASLKPLLHFDGIVTRVEDEQGTRPSFPEPFQQNLHLPTSNLVGILCGANALYVHGRGPTLAHKVQLCDELVGSSGHDGLPGRVSGWMVVETTLGAAFRVATIPHANVYGVDGRIALSKRMAGEESP
jgi:hypothetical protein